MFKPYLWLLGKTAWYFLGRRNIAQTAVTLIFLFILAALAVISYFAGSSFIKYVVSFETFSPALLRFTLLSMILALSVLAFLSFTITFLKTLFDKNLFLILVTGRDIGETVLAVFIGTLSFGSWPFLLISLPFFLGMSQNLFLVLFSHLILSVLVAALAGGTAILTQRIFGRSLKRILPAAALIGLIGLFFLFTNVIYPSNLRVISSARTVSEVEYSLKTLPLSWSFLPSTLFVDAFLGKAMSLVLLAIEAVFLTAVFVVIAKVFYLKAWQAVNEVKTELPFSKWHFSKKVKLAFMQKELLSIVRDSNAFLYLSFILFLVSVFIFFLSQAGDLTRDYSRLMPLVKISSYFSVSYILLLLCLRFVFPSLTLERPYMWLVITVSKIRDYVFGAKWLFYQFFLFIFIIVLGVATGEYLKILVFAAIGIIMTSTTFLVGGVFQHDLPKRDVEAIATTGPGMLFTTVSLVIGGTASLFLKSVESTVIYLWMLVVSVSFAASSYYFTRRMFKRSDL